MPTFITRYLTLLSWAKCFCNSCAARQVLPVSSYILAGIPRFRITLSMSVFQFHRRFLSWKPVPVVGWGLCEWSGCPLRETGRGTTCSCGTARPWCSTPHSRRTPASTSSTTWALSRGDSTVWTSLWRAVICRARLAAQGEQVSVLAWEAWECKVFSWDLWAMRKKRMAESRDEFHY